MKNWYVVTYEKATNKCLGLVSGLGNNRHTWDSNHSERVAKKYAKLLNIGESKYIYIAESDWVQL